MTPPDPHTAIAERLEACPFCGGRDLSVETYSVQPDDYHSGHVTCADCDTQGPRPGEWLANADEAKRDAIAAWNTRASADEVEQLRQAHRDADEQWGLASRAHQKAEAELERLNKALKYEQDRSDRIGTHGPGCFTWGHRHYDCALIENARLESELERLRAGSGKTELTADFVRALPGGKLDDATYEAIESALDKAEAPCQLDGRWLTLPERVSALQWDRDSLAKSFVESNREIRRIQAEAVAAWNTRADFLRTGGEPWRVMTPEEYAALRLKGKHIVERDWDGCGGVAVWMTADFLDALPGQAWQPIETAPKDGTHFLAYCIDVIDEYDEDDRLIARAVPTPTMVLAYEVYWLGGIVEYPYRGSILQNRRYVAWQPLPAPPPPGGDKP